MDRNAGLTEAAKEKILKAGHGLAADQSVRSEEGPSEDSLKLPVYSRPAKASKWAMSPVRKLQAKAEEEERLRPEREREERAQAGKEAMAIALENPILQERYNLLKRRTTQDLISPDYMDRWEESAREGAEEQKAAILSRARAMGLNASQMEALNQSLQETDATFERQIQKLRFENRESAKEEFENFTLALQTEGANQIHAQQSLALQAERDRSARSRTLWGSILGFVGGVAGGVAGFMATGGNPMGAVAGASAGSAALGALGRSV
tara:strand:- start:1204 stop:2001 length:798 start_codon:yes stop_codon:yes gene_type:complete